jgi:hypothetical protein
MNLKTEIAKATAQTKQKLIDIRSRMDEAKNERDWLESAPLTIEDAIVNAEKSVDAYASLDGVRGFFSPNGLAIESIFQQRTRINYGDVICPEGSTVVSGSIVVDVSHVVCSLFPVEIKAKLAELIKLKSADIDSGPSLAERPALIKAAQDRLYQLEVEEESLIYDAESIGLTGFYRRPDCNPEIVLMMEA